MVDKVMFSTGKDDWETPDDLFLWLEQQFNFTLDPCSDGKNNKLPKFFTEEQDGLKQSWSSERVFVNPPYSRNQQKKWIKKCFDEVRSGNCPIAVALLPARTDTVAFHNFIANASQIWFIKGRLKFVGSKNSAPFPSMIVVWEKDRNDLVVKFINTKEVISHNAKT